ncbi:2,3-bisphosphoglycerate-independent phosphoglycerate mutase [candidate division GN15 bacterium]|uniref:2,3-bisphosphoglycerate-independent phosphoglycerate mutase n=1 Tax=candidate division GN15 bacterium TaxID=2072418 RepID=A0A855X445_9BACT|nr:MAG: 2,3-bisphosphoglycerate-independent phosphoglycerate mutase [candidate division GN15 bacterium]
MFVLLCVLDGFGLREATPDNAVAAAVKPVYDRLLQTCPHTAIDGSGPSVGLPVGQMGNSEVGHLNLGAGRVVYQDITRIDKAIDTGEFFDNEVLCAGMERIAAEGKAVHLFGLVSDGCVHSSLKHLFALVELAHRKKVKELYLHAFTDGRDTPPNSGQHYLAEVIKKFQEIGLGRVSTVAGRYYGMDRDRRWERTDKSYRAIVYGEGPRFRDPVSAITASYEEQITDEFVVPAVIDLGDPSIGRLKDRDLAIMFNFRSDRARQLSYMLVGHDILGYVHPQHPVIELITMTNFDQKLFEAKVAFHQRPIRNTLAELLSKAGMKQLHTAETEKYAHVTFFFNGGVEEPALGEDRDMIASPKVPTYDLQPEMSAAPVTTNAIMRIGSNAYGFVLVNYANCDMVGHTGVFSAAKRAVEAVDTQLGRLLQAVDEQKGVALITADHGNAEMMIDPRTGGPWTAHTTNLVPFILYDPTGVLNGQSGPGKISLRQGGVLADVAPTVLEIFGLPIPKEMTGKSLIVRG